MYKGKFELLGHDNPLGQYPAPVVPVGRLDDSMVAVYASREFDQEIVCIDQEAEFVRHDGTTRATLAGFDYLIHRLFAFDENNIRYYSIQEEAYFFEQLLQEPIIKQQDPFFRLSLAKGSKVRDLINKEIVSCLKELNSEPDADAAVFVTSWYEAQRKATSNQTRLGISALPKDWRKLLENKSATLSDRVLAARSFTGLTFVVFAFGLIAIAILFIAKASLPSTPTEDHFSLLSMIRSMGAVAIGVVIVLLIMSVYSIAIIVERYLTYTAAKKQSREFAPRVAQALRNNRIEEAISISDKHRKSHLAMVVSSGLQEFRAHEKSSDISGDEIDASKRALQRAIAIKTAEFNRGLSGLATIGSTAPFIGLFGTVFGIINAFRKMGNVDQSGIAIVASGISEALFTTALGLVLAVPAVWIFNYFTGKVDGFVVEMENSASDVEDYIKEHATRMDARAKS